MTGIWTAAALAVIAAGTEYYNGQQVAKKQDNTLANELRQQGLLQKQAQQKTSDLINKTAQSNDTGAKASLLDQFMQQMQQQGGNVKSGLNQVGNVSSAYTKAANDAASGIASYGDNRAGLAASIDAPGVQRQNEAADLSRYGSGIGLLKQNSDALDFLTQMKLRGIRPNPWISAVSDLAGSYSKSMAAGGGGSTSSAGGNYSQGNTYGMGDGFTVNLPNN